MGNSIYTRINKAALKDHVKRICKKNIKSKCNCCQQCPFREAVDDTLIVLDVEKKLGKPSPEGADL